MTASVNVGELLAEAGLTEEPEPLNPLGLEEARDAAVALIEAGFAIVPAWGVVEPGVCACGRVDCASKHTVFRGWGTTDRAFMEADHAAKWWSPRFQGRKRAVDNIAVVAYGSGVIVADVDDPGRFETWTNRYGGVPQTLCSTTGRGRHYYFRPPPETVAQLPKARNRLGMSSGEWRWKAIVIAPPSVHLGTGVRYRWSAGDLTTPVAELPAWMHDHAFTPSAKAVQASVAGDAFVQKAAQGLLGVPQCRRLADLALQDAVRDIARAKPGTRRTLLNAAAFNVGKWGCAARWATENWWTARTELIRAARLCALPEREAIETIEVALNDGAATFREMS